MSYAVDFVNVSTVGLESSPVAAGGASLLVVASVLALWGAVRTISLVPGADGS